MRHHFMFLHKCGCPRGLVDRIAGCRTEDDAWDLMFEDRRAERRARADGITVKLVDHEVYSRDYYDRMTGRCPHQGGAA